MPDPLLTEIGWAGSALRLAGTLKPDGPVSEIEVLLRERDGGGLLRVPASAAARDGRVAFEAEVDVATLVGGHPVPGGLWDVSLSVGAPMGTAVVPLGRGRAPGLDASPLRRFLPGSCTVIAYFGDGGLAIDVGGRPHVAGSVAADTLSWNEEREEVVVTGHLDLRRTGMPISGTLQMTERRSRHVYGVIAMLEERPDRLGYRAAVPATRAFIDDPLPRGTWDVSLCLGFSGMHRELRLLAPDEPVDVQVWRRLRHVRVVSSAAPGPLTIMVGRV
ncbi:hypothetical protein ACQEU6_42185 [Spirillospora sp. CA-108201]